MPARPPHDDPTIFRCPLQYGARAYRETFADLRRDRNLALGS